MKIFESEMEFGEFDEKNLFWIENSRIYKNLGQGIRTVEFILKYNKDSIYFLEAKKSCPNPANQNESDEKRLKFEEYFSSITEKFVASLQIYLAAILNKYQNTTEVGSELSSIKSMGNVKLKFILVIKKADDIAWLAGPTVELKARLLPIRKIWGVEIVVLNEELAIEHRLIRANT